MLVELYTDGASQGNPGPGGYGLVLKYGAHEKELSEGFRKTTNNRMELLAVIVGLESLTRKQVNVRVFTDSRYVSDAVNKKWLFGWEKVNFKKKKNPDLWKRFLKVYREHHVEIKWIKGHSDHPYNDRCDELAVRAAKQAFLKTDELYEAENP